MGRYVGITEQEMDDYLQQSKGWEKNKSGYEYVYDYKIKQIPSTMIKVLSSVNTGEGKSNKGSHAIRVFAVRTSFDIESGRDKIVGGYIPKRIVQITTNWRKDLEEACKSVMRQIFERAKRERINYIISRELKKWLYER